MANSNSKQVEGIQNTLSELQEKVVVALIWRQIWVFIVPSCAQYDVLQKEKGEQEEQIMRSRVDQMRNWIDNYEGDMTEQTGQVNLLKGELGKVLEEISHKNLEMVDMKKLKDLLVLTYNKHQVCVCPPRL